MPCNTQHTPKNKKLRNKKACVTVIGHTGGTDTISALASSPEMIYANLKVLNIYTKSFKIYLSMKAKNQVSILPFLGKWAP